MGRKSLAEQRRTEIINAFYHCVVKDGFAGTSIRKIAREAGVQPSTLHHYFKDRDEIIEQMVAHFTETIVTHFIARMDRHTDPATRFDRALEFLFGADMINDEYTGFFLECCVEARRNPRVRQMLARTFRRFRQTIIDYISDMEPFHRLPPDRKNVYASLLIAVHEGLELQWYIEPAAVSLKKSFELTRALVKMMGKEGLPEAEAKAAGDVIPLAARK